MKHTGTTQSTVCHDRHVLESFIDICSFVHTVSLSACVRRHGTRTEKILASAQRSTGGSRVGPNGVHCYQEIIAMKTANANAVTPGAVKMLLLLLTHA